MSTHHRRPPKKQQIPVNARRRKKRRARRRKSSIAPVIGTIVFILLVIGALAGYFLFRRYSYGTERADLNAYFQTTDASSYPVYVRGEATGTVARKFDGTCYLSLEDVHAHVSNRFYYGAADGILVYTTPTEILTAQIGDTTLSSSAGEAQSFPYIIARTEGETLYVAMDFLRNFANLEYTAYDDPNHLHMTMGTVTEETALITKDTALRLRGGVKSEILKDLEKGERVIIIDTSLGDWIKVRTEDDYTGYVESKRLSEFSPFTYGAERVQEPVYTSISKPYTICLGWHQIGGPAGNDTLEEVLQNTRGMNTISPTWIALSDNTGSISSFGSREYVATAHARGLEVWALVSNFANEGIDVQQVLSHAASRKKLIDNLMAEVADLSLDGLNIDFEEVPPEAGRDYIQFIRELSIACRSAGIVLSIDNYVPYGFNDYYDRTEQGIVADYVIIMGYDEHYAGSPEAGSVASLEYVRYGIEATCAQVPASKVINAVPFYTRVWTTSGAGVSSYATGMDAAREAAADHGMTLTWDDACAQYYGQTTTNAGSRVEIWLEDAESIEAKITVMRTNEIAGIACWRLGLESSDVWDVIANYVAR